MGRPADTMADTLAKLAAIKASHPGNRAARHFDPAYYESLGEEDRAALLAAVASGVANPSSSVGAYATRPTDYDTLSGFFDPLIADYHGMGAAAVQTSDWSVPSRTDLAAVGMGPTSCRVRVGRNLAAFPLPAGMTADQRVALEDAMMVAFKVLAAQFGGEYHSLTPGRAISDDAYAALVADHLMFKSMADDVYLAAAGISADWPTGRGAYISADRRISIWVNEEDHLRVTCMCTTTDPAEPFRLLATTLAALEAQPGMTFARSRRYGNVTSCPSNLGTGMRASVHLALPALTSDGTTAAAEAVAKPAGLSVRGTGGEHTPVVAGVVDLSPSARFGLTEAQVIGRLVDGVKLMLAAEAAAAK